MELGGWFVLCDQELLVTNVSWREKTRAQGLRKRGGGRCLLP